MRNPLVAILLMMITGPAFAQDDPVAVIEDTTSALAQLIENKRETYKEDPEALKSDVKSTLLPSIDTVYTARLVLGRHSRGRDREQIEAFAEALASQLLDRYATSLLEYDLLERVEILELAGDNSDRQTRVRTRVQLDGNDRAPVDYVMRKTEEGWQVFDVIVEGISYVATFRSQIDQEIRRDGFDSLLERLETGRYELEVDE